VGLFVGLVLVLASIGVAPYLGTDQRVGLLVGLLLLLAGLGVAPYLGTGQRVALFVGLLLLLAGIGIGVRPLGHATGELGTLYCTVSPPGTLPPTTTTILRFGRTPFTYFPPRAPQGAPLPRNPIGQGECPSQTYGPDLISSLKRSCGSALMPASYDAGALVLSGGRQQIPAGATQAWSVVPPCAHRLSTWRYPAIALLVAGAIVALTGFFIFRRRPAAQGANEIQR
jgi:hypothetical protein